MPTSVTSSTAGRAENVALRGLEKLLVQVIQAISDIEESEQHCMRDGVASGDGSDGNRMSRLNFKIASMLGNGSSNVLIFCHNHFQRNGSTKPEATLRHDAFIVIKVGVQMLQ